MSDRPVLLLGARGQLGSEILRVGAFPMFVPPREETDLLRPDTLREVVFRINPRLVINAAAETAVDRAETDPDLSRAANAVAPAVLAEACAERGARLIHFSTDYVFSGEATRPYGEEDPTAPVNTYGRHKLEGERAALAAHPRNLVFRLSWIYSTSGRNFALTMLRLAREGKPIRVVDDQIGSPTYAREIAEAVAQVAEQVLADPDSLGGLYHLSAAGSTSWHGFAQALLTAKLGAEAPEVEPIQSSAFPTPAKRPRYSVLDNSKVTERFGVRLADWESQVARWARDME